MPGISEEGKAKIRRMSREVIDKYGRRSSTRDKTPDLGSGSARKAQEARRTRGDKLAERLRAEGID